MHNAQSEVTSGVGWAESGDVPLLLQASGVFSSPGPRRSARFANQQKSGGGSNNSSSQRQQQPDGSARTNRQPGAGTAQAQVQRSWSQTIAWIAWTLLGLLVAVMAATNPSRATFADSIRQLTSRGLGQWAGMATFSLPPMDAVGTTWVKYYLLSES